MTRVEAAASTSKVSTIGPTVFRRRVNDVLLLANEDHSVS